MICKGSKDETRIEFEKIWWVVRLHVSLSQHTHRCGRSGVTPQKTCLAHLFVRHLGVDGHGFMLKVKVRKRKRLPETEAKFRSKAPVGWSWDAEAEIC